MAPVRILFASTRFSAGNAALARALQRALIERRPGLSLEPFPPSSPAEAAAAVVAAAPTLHDLRESRDLLSSFTGLIPAARIFRLLWHVGVEGGLPFAEARAAMGGVDAVLPFEPDVTLAAEASGTLVQEFRPKSRVSKAIGDAAAALAAFVPESTEAPLLAPAETAAAVAARVWARLERGAGGEGVDAVIDEELASHLAAAGGRLGPAGLAETRRLLAEDILGLGPIEAFLSDPEVSEIMVNGGGTIFVERAGRVERADRRFGGDDRLRLTIARIVSPAGRRVDLASPLCDVRLPDGSRANVVLPPVSVDGPLVTIRRFRPAFATLEDLIKAGALDERQAERLAAAVRERRNIVVAGNSGAGKTTLLNALAAFIPDEERVITLEDAAELRLAKPHVVRLETRPENAEGRGAVTMRDLVINALRMRPDRLIVGECRGAEAIPMLQAMNTGHDGSLTTLHANSAADVVERLESMVLIGAPQWPASVVRRQIRSAIHLVAYLRRTGGARRLESLGPLPAEDGAA